MDFGHTLPYRTAVDYVQIEIFYLPDWMVRIGIERYGSFIKVIEGYGLEKAVTSCLMLPTFKTHCQVGMQIRKQWPPLLVFTVIII